MEEAGVREKIIRELAELKGWDQKERESCRKR